MSFFHSKKNARKPANELRGFLAFWKPRRLVAGFQVKDLFVIFSFLILVLLFFFRFLNGQTIFAFKDLSRYFYPLRFLMVEQVKSGLWPLWNPYIFCGFPLMATLQVCFFYPLTILYYLLPFNLAFNYYVILHYFLAACFMFALLRHYQLSRSAAFFGGIVFAFSGYLLSVSNMNTSLSSVIWLPLALLFLDKLINSSLVIRNSSLIWLTVVLALMFLGGEPTILYVTLWFLLLYALVFSGRRILTLTFLALSLLLALGLVAVQLLPFIELSRLSDRVVLTSFDVISFRSLPIRDVITFIFPYFFGNQAQFGGYTETLLGKEIQDWLISPYLGIVPLIFIFFSFRQKRSLFFLLAALAALLLALGRYTPIYWLAYKSIPGVSLIRYPIKYLFLTTFCLSLLAAMGFDDILRSFDKARERFKRPLLILILLSILLLVLSVFGYVSLQKIYGLLAHKYPQNIPEVFFRLLAEILEFNLLSLFNLTAYLFILGLLFWAAYREKIKKSIFVGGVLLLVIADLLANGSSIATGASARVFSELPENLAVLKQDKGLYRFFRTPDLEEGSRMIYGENYSAALLNSKDNFTSNWHIPYHLFDFYGYESIRLQGMVNFLHANLTKDKFKKNFRFLSLFNVKYVASMDKLTFPELKFLRHKYKYGQNIYLYENKKVYPRAYLLDREMKPDLKLGEVVFKEYRPGKMLMGVDAKGPGTLFLSETYYPGWKVSVDGREVKTSLANDLFFAVPMAEGRHEVKFFYDPLSFKLGAVVSLFSLALIGCLLFRRAGR